MAAAAATAGSGQVADYIPALATVPNVCKPMRDSVFTVTSAKGEASQ